MRVSVVLNLVAIVYAGNLGYMYRSAEHSGPGLPAAANSVAGGLSSLFNSASGFDGARNGISTSVSNNSPVNFSDYQIEFYTFTAPEDVFDDAIANEKIAGSLKKKIRVIFIKNPENQAYENAVLALLKQAIEQKTAIYVLNKQHDVSDLAEKFNAVHNNNNNPPEVHFVKYRTTEDAVNAQKAIQRQYHAAGDSSQKYKTNAFPERNYPSGAQHQSRDAPQMPNNSYLHSSLFPR